MTISETQNRFYQWYFRKSERSIEKDTDADAISYRYVMPGKTLRRRLELDGYNLVSLQREFDQQLLQMQKDCKAMIEIDPNGKASRLLPVLERSTLKNWLTRLGQISEQKLESSAWGTPDKEFGDALLNFMLSSEPCYFSDYPGAGGYSFPCTTEDGYAVALLEVLPEDVTCILDISDLISGGWTDAFDDLVEFQQKYTNFYGAFKLAINDVISLMELAPDNEALCRMLYASVITAVETYLSDTLRKQVFVKPSVKRRFVESHGKFRGNLFGLNDIYTRLETLDTVIAKVIDEESFHSIISVKSLYQNVLLTHIPKNHMDKLLLAVSIRHDIVHRNGKSLLGKRHIISLTEVKQLIEDVDAAIQHIDKQVKDGLLEEDSEA
jgi:hypothetical protein